MKKILTLILSVTIICLMFGQNQGDGVIAYDESNEISERRGLHEKHYLRSDGNIDMKVSSEPLHYLENNKWETIDSRITDNTSNDFVGYEYANTKNSFKSYYSSDVIKGFVTSFKDGSIIQEFQDVKMYYMDAAENISGIQSISSSSKFKLSDNAITHQDIFLSTDVNITQQNGKRKLDFVLKDVTAVGNAPSNAKFLVFEETTILPDGFYATLENQSIVIEDASGNFVAQYDAPYAYSTGAREETSSNTSAEGNTIYGLIEDERAFKHSENIVNEGPEAMNQVRYDISQTVDNKLTIKTIVDMNWLIQNENNYPIVIDPTLSASRNITGTGYTSYGGYGGYGPPGIITSGAPANSKITNVNVSFNVASNSRWYNPPGWWTPTGWYSYSGKCNNYHRFALFNGSGSGWYTCGGNLDFDCQNPNTIWYTEIFRTSWDVYARWGYSVTVTYYTLDNGGLNYSGLTSACTGYDPPTISVSSVNTSYGNSYQWQQRSNINMQWYNINGATSTSFNPGPLTSPGTYAFRRRVSGACGELTYSSVLTITVGYNPTITSTAEDMCEGSTKTLVASPSGGSFSGTGVSGNTFTAPVPSGNDQTYTITYSKAGCASTTQQIKVYKTPTSASAGPDVHSCMTGTATMAATQPSVGTGIWTWQTQPTYTSGNPITPTATVGFSSGGTHTGTWTISNGACGDAANPQTADVVVTSGANNMTLVNSTSVTAVEVCTEGLWTYYATAAKPDEYLFAIDKNGNTFTADVTITDIAGSAPIESLGGNLRGTWLLSRYWNASIKSGSITTTVAIRYFIDDAELTAAQNKANAFLASSPLSGVSALTPLTFFKTQSAAFDPNTDLANGDFTFTPTYLNIKSTGTTNGLTYYELDGITSFSGGTGGFGVNDGGSSLPVELISFNAKAVDNQYIQLDWATATEINNDGFEVLRSTNGIDFERIAWMDGHGNSTEKNEYVFKDHGVNKGVNYYYQLKQIDYDGQYEYFDIKTARLEGQTNFFIGTLVPNPSKGNDVVSVDVETTTGEVMTVQIFDQIGAEVKKVTYMLFAAENGLDIDVSDLVDGTYFLTFETRMGKETRKLVVIK